jgi:hypothetical protein
MAYFEVAAGGLFWVAADIRREAVQFVGQGVNLAVSGSDGVV